MTAQERGDMNHHTNTHCPKCGAAISQDAPAGLCPNCVLEGAAAAVNLSGTSGRKSVPPSIKEIAKHLPDLEVIELLGAGGMGTVYKARQPQLDRTVALKILSHDLAADPAFVERFNREAKMLARLSHPNIVGVFDFGTAGPCCYLLMEYVDGVNLRQAMRTGGFTPPEALALVQEICAALKFAHENGILHRDIKPENILLDSKGSVKIADFGIAKMIGEGERSDVTLTLQGSILGSPHYMAPEQLDSPGNVDQRADIYSLGVVLYEMLTGELPIGRFAAPSAKVAMDARIDEIVMRTLERERELRFQTIGEMKTQVEAVTEAKTGAQSPDAPRDQTVGISSGKTARFANASAALTALSGAVSILFLPMVLRLCDMTGQLRMQERDVVWFLAVVLLLLTVTAGPGMMLAVRALRGIRETGGRAAGFKRAMVALLAWPALLVMFMTWAGISALFHDSGLSISWRLLVGLLLFVSSGLGVVMIRRVFHWTKEDARPAAALGGHVWRFCAAALVALIFMGAHVRKRAASMDTYLEPGGTRMAAELRVAAGKDIHFRLIRVNAQGKVTPLDLNGSIHSHEAQGFRTTLELVSTDRWKESARQQLTANYQTPDGNNYSRSVYLDENWKFDASGKSSLPLMEGQRQRFEFATRHDWLGRKVETLYLDVVGADGTSSDHNAMRPKAPAPEAKTQP
jgi:tRNA A-37 threonylcarbamoyl transferase component Bud32